MFVRGDKVTNLHSQYRMKSKMYKVKMFVISVIVALAAGSAYAQTPKLIKQNDAWGAFQYNDQKDGRICYALSVPTSLKPTNRNHGDVFFMVSQRPGENKGLEPQIKVGYSFKEKTDITIDVDGKKFIMFGHENYAWLKNLEDEKNLIRSMQRGKKMNVQATSRRGTKTEYAYSLTGVTAALKEVQKCKK